MSAPNGHRGAAHHENHAESAYPPPPGEEDDRQRSQYQHLPPPAHVTLPPIQDGHPAYGARYAPQPDPRVQGNFAASPTGTNGYGAPPPSNYQLPPVQPPTDHRYNGEPQHRPYYEARGGSYPPVPPPPQTGQPQPEQYNYTYRPSPGAMPYGAEYARAGPSNAAQAAPRQRTSIACSYCRRRKIRCSGYGTSDGVCSNCRKTGNKCVFQPVSSSSTTAFVPVSAIPGGVAPGTQLFGAFGQPLSQVAGAAGQAGPGGAPLPPPPAGAQVYAPQPQQPEGAYAGHSPRTSYYPPPPEDPSGRRRLHEDDHGSRLPPPNPYGDPDPRRRSPASPSQGGTPPGVQYEYPPSTGGYDQGDRTGTPRRDSPNSPQQSGSGPMSLTALMDQHPPPRPPPNADASRDIDQNMLGRLNRRT
ncbi:hypothetical protein BD289DRAFT_478763 [Coniella lustricola]|uniref:Zn(2)-C6 fungal-type domain-containing protein n=1 Tax=Coniella lustricola TaxID=2025994 RepID=A0A2T3ALT4_9PEZI|nr:hypothetical protein BD289DRAFT_478763 [Coniella lustricola]